MDATKTQKKAQQKDAQKELSKRPPAASGPLPSYPQTIVKIVTS